MAQIGRLTAPALRPSSAARASAAALLSLCLMSSVPAWAQSPETPSAQSAAEQADAAFAEGRDLFDQGRFREACEKFELSQRLDPSPGTLLNLGNCYEPQGNLVLALGTFERALEGARLATDPTKMQLWSEAAKERIASLTPRISVVTVRGADAGVHVLIAGQPVELGAPIRLNPGRYVLEASAAGKRSQTRQFDVTAGQRLVVDLGPLEPEAAPPLATEVVSSAPPEALEPPAGHTSASQYGVLPWVLGGSGLALLGASLITGLSANSKENRLEDECTGMTADGKRECAPSLEGVRDSAETLALVTDVLWITGVVAAGVGVTLFVLDDGGTESGTALQTGCFDAGCGVLATGRF